MRIGLPISSYPQCLPHRPFSTTPCQTGPDFDRIRQDLLSRPLNILEDSLSPTNSQLLNLSLSDFLPPSCQPPPATGGKNRRFILPQGHHLVYFPTRATSSQLLPDGTDTFHSPGAPFVRRMWAGGSVHFSTHREDMPRLKPHNQNRAVCLEGIRDVRIKGTPDKEKIFVDVERQYALGSRYDRLVPAHNPGLERTQFFMRTPDQFSPFFIFEKRTLVFMRAEADDRREDQSNSNRFVKTSLEAEFNMQIVPTPSLLFRFSALSFNAHLIHLSPQYASGVEGHRDMLVHGPLTLVLILSLLRSQLQKGQMVSSFHYRNLAPLYVNEMMKVCGKRRPNGSFTMWIEDSRGSLAVKGDAEIATKGVDDPSDEEVHSENERRDVPMDQKSMNITTPEVNEEHINQIPMEQKDMDTAIQTTSSVTVPANMSENQPEVEQRRDFRIIKHVSLKGEMKDDKIREALMLDLFRKKVRKVKVEPRTELRIRQYPSIKPVTAKDTRRQEAIRLHQKVREFLMNKVKRAGLRRGLRRGLMNGTKEERIQRALKQHLRLRKLVIRGLKISKHVSTKREPVKADKIQEAVRQHLRQRRRKVSRRDEFGLRKLPIRRPLQFRRIMRIRRLPGKHRLKHRTQQPNDWRDQFNQMLRKDDNVKSSSTLTTDAEHDPPIRSVSSLRIRSMMVQPLWREKYRRMLSRARKTRRNPYRARALVERREEIVERERVEDLRLVDELFGLVGKKD